MHPAPPDIASGKPAWHERNVIAIAVLVAMAFAAYYPALSNGFYNDDALFLNHAKRALEDWTAIFKERPLGYLRPVWSAWVTLLYAAFGTSPRGYFAAGILLHSACAFLVYRIAIRLLRDGFAALLAAIVFTVAFAHCEATLWIAAHNSSLVCFFAAAALLAHLRACERNTIGSAFVTGGLVVGMLLAKEPGIVATAWLPLAEWRTRGFKACFEKRALTRYGIIAGAALIYLAINPRLISDALASSSAGAPRELRSTLGFVTPERLIGTSAWMFAPFRFVEADLVLWPGILALAGPCLVALALSRRRLSDALLAAAVTLIAIAPSCSTRLLQFNGSRLFYFPTVGTALAAGVVLVCVLDRFRGGSERAARIACAIVVAGYAAVSISAIHRLDRSDYAPISQAQTTLAREVGPALAGSRSAFTHLVEPWLDNEMHAKEFLELFAAIDPKRVRKIEMKRDDAATFIERQGQIGNLVLDCDAEGHLIPAAGAPSSRNSAQNTPRTADTGVRNPMVRFMSIAR